MRRTLATAGAAFLLTLAACSSAGQDDAGGSQAEDASAPVHAGDPAASTESAGRDLDAENAVVDAVDEPAGERSVISTGHVELRSDDVGRAALEVRQVVDRAAGEVEEQQTTADDAGEVTHAHLVLRVPSARFSESFAALEGVADLVGSGTESTDVTTEVLDVDIRVQVQRRSIQRIALLLDRAESIRDVVSIEAQLSRRQADLASLERRQAHLADQTSMSTVTVTVERTPGAPVEKQGDEAGFLTGLDAGWDALRTVGSGLATVAGAVLPWLPVLLLVAVPAWPLARRLRRRTTTAAAG